MDLRTGRIQCRGRFPPPGSVTSKPCPTTRRPEYRGSRTHRPRVGAGVDRLWAAALRHRVTLQAVTLDAITKVPTRECCRYPPVDAPRCADTNRCAARPASSPLDCARVILALAPATDPAEYSQKPILCPLTFVPHSAYHGVVRGALRNGKPKVASAPRSSSTWFYPAGSHPPRKRSTARKPGG